MSKQNKEARWLERAFAGGTFFRFPKLYLSMMSRDAAIMLAFLTDQSSLHKAHVNGGWFYCTVDTIQKHLFMDRNVQTRVLNELRSLGYIKIEKRGLPAKRHVKIGYSKLHRMLDKIEDENEKEWELNQKPDQNLA